jgi:GNAT superfamily N-acetyltransferase
MNEQAQAGVRIRPGRLEDNHACAAVLAEAVNDLGRRQGSIEPGAELVLEDQWPKWRPFMDHVARTAAEFWVAEGDGRELIGYARSVDRDGAFELTELFVRPGTQSAGLGTRLLERAFPLGRGHLRIIIATTDIRALSRYLRADVLPRFPVLSFSGPAREAPPVDGLAVESLDLERDMASVNAIDDDVLGHRREVDHRWYAEEREGYRYLHDGSMVGYGYVALPERGGTGPFAVLDAVDLPAVLSHAERRRHQLGAEDASFEVPLHNRAAIDHLLGRGYRMDPFMTLVCSSAPFGNFDRYLMCGPALVL